jgi:primosomal protein N'
MAIQAASRQDYEAFYNAEIESRRELGYPPFRRLARLLIRQRSAPQAQREAEQAARLLTTRIRQMQLDATSLIGPAPCFFSKLEGYYRWHILVRSPEPATVSTGWTWPGAGTWTSIHWTCCSRAAQSYRINGKTNRHDAKNAKKKRGENKL